MGTVLQTACFNRLAYACRSPRTHEELILKVCDLVGFKPLIFDSVDMKGEPVYHTNVVLAIGEKFAVVCLDSIKSENDQDKLLDSFERTGHKVVAISFEQMYSFAGNLIEVKNKKGESCILLSAAAFNSLLPGQIDAISRYADMIPIPVETIEKYGGGSVRCMMAGIYLPYRSGIQQ